MSESIDPDAIAALVALRRPGKPDLVARVVGLFRDETPRLLAAIDTALEQGDADGVRVAAHTLKSSAAYLGARAFSDTCSRLERSARDGNLVDGTLLADELFALFDGTVEALDDAVPKAA